MTSDQVAGPPVADRGGPGGDPGPARDRGSERRGRLAALLVAAREGEEKALGEVVAELTPMLWQVVRAQGLSVQAAEDVVQNTWLTLMRHLGAIREPAALIEWLVITARREAWRARSGTRDQELLGDGVFDNFRDAAALPEEELLADERRLRLWRAVNRLSAQCRELLRIVAFVHRPNYNAVAAALGMPRGSIGPTRGRCLTALRRFLSEEGTP